jgi:hypothetical protein
MPDDESKFSSGGSCAYPIKCPVCGAPLPTQSDPRMPREAVDAHATRLLAAVSAELARESDGTEASGPRASGRVARKS